MAGEVILPQSCPHEARGKGVMAENEPQKSGAEYQGLPGRTHQVVIHYTCYGCGLTFGAKAWRTVNVASDPELADLLSRGELNTLTCPGCNASCLPNLPLVYHDPQARHFALLLPEAMRHLELDARRALLAELDADEAPIPDYVKRVEVAFGTAGLVKLLDDSIEALSPKDREDEPARLAALHAQRQAELEQREEALLAREEDLLAKQEDLVSTRAKLEHAEDALAQARRDLEREREALRALSLDLEARERALRERERKVEAAASAAAPAPDAPAEPAPAATSVAVAPTLEGRPQAEVDRFRAGDRPAQHLLHEGRVFLFAKLGAEAASALGAVEPTLVVQLHRLAGVPLVTLAALPSDGTGGEDRAAGALYWQLDPATPADRSLLAKLGEDFHLDLDLYDEEARPLRSWEIQAPLSENVRHLLSRVDAWLASPPPGAGQFEEAVQAYRELGEERLGRKQHNFSADSFPDLATPAAARLALGIVSYWSEPENEDYLTLVKSFPLLYWRGVRERVVRRALEFGLRLPAPLRDFALERKLAASKEELLRSLVSSFAEVSLRIKPSDLDPGQEWENWKLLLADCVQVGVQVDPEMEELAAAAARRAGSLEAEAAGSEDLTELDEAALIAKLSDRDLRRDVALELCERGRHAALEPVWGAITNMTRTEVARVLPAMIRFGAKAVPLLVQGLRHRKSFIRQGAALALGTLKAEAAVEPLLDLMLGEPTNVWREAARALGDMGSVSLGALIAALRTGDAAGRERVAWALAQSAMDAGCRAEVEAMTRGRDARLARAAQRAIELVDQVRQADQEVRGEGKPSGEQTVVRAFSRRFFESLSPDVSELGEGDIVEQEEMLDERDILDEEVMVHDDDIVDRRSR